MRDVMSDGVAARYRAILDILPHAVEEIDQDFRIVFANLAMHRLHGVSPGGLVGRSLWDFVPAEIAAACRPLFLEAMAAQRPPEPQRTTFALADGGLAEVEVEWNCRLDATGAVVGLVGVFTDVTARCKAELAARQGEELLNVILRTSPVGIGFMDDDARLLYWNRPLADILGVGETECGDLRLADFLRDRQDMSRIDRQIHSGHVVKSYPIQMARRDGAVRWVLISCQCANYHDQPGAFAWFYDVTAWKEAENRLVAAKEEAEQAFNALRRVQQDLIQTEKVASLGEIVAGVAHEVNTPIGIALTAITHLEGEAERTRILFDGNRLRKQDFTDFMETLNDTARIVLANLSRAAELMQSFKKVSADRTCDERRAFDLPLYIRDVLFSLGPAIKKAGLRSVVEGEDGVTINGYPGALAQILTNLVMNAIHHAYEPGGGGTLTTAVGVMDGNTVELRFADDGKGIPAQNLARIFDPFFSTRRASGGGTGLGLNIVRTMVTDTLGGTIEVESAPGQGTTFILRFPRHMPMN
ncbi:MAG TPA: PAS domain S-box protein [Azospirillaceae bacterium]|nr:PAS domain S-box protein [Azospirillaceae bacterium]